MHWLLLGRVGRLSEAVSQSHSEGVSCQLGTEFRSFPAQNRRHCWVRTGGSTWRCVQAAERTVSWGWNGWHQSQVCQVVYMGDPHSSVNHVIYDKCLLTVTCTSFSFTIVIIIINLFMKFRKVLTSELLKNLMCIIAVLLLLYFMVWRRFCIGNKVNCEGAHPLDGALNWWGLDSVNLAYNSCYSDDQLILRIRTINWLSQYSSCPVVWHSG